LRRFISSLFFCEEIPMWQGRRGWQAGRRAALRLAVVAMAAAPCGSDAAPRTWRDESGQFQVDAEFVRVEGAHVVLKTAEGKQLKAPLSKLSADDRKAVGKLLAEANRSAAGVAPPGGEADAVRDVARRFYALMAEEQRDGLRPLLTASAQKIWDAGGSPAAQLPRPAAGRATRLGKVTIDGDQASVQARLRIDDESYPTVLHFRREGGKWRALALTAEQEEGEKRIDFEAAEGSPGDYSAPRAEGGAEPPPGADAAPAAAEADPSLVVPDGDPEQLLAFIDRASRLPPPADVDPQVGLSRVLGAVIEASERILNGQGVAEPVLRKAFAHQVKALRGLIPLEPERARAQAQALRGHAQRLGLAALDRPLAALALQTRLGAARDASAGLPIVAEITRFIGDGPLHNSEWSLMAATSQFASTLPDDVSLEFHRVAGDRLATVDNPAARELGAQLQGVARRLGLVGETMRLAGVLPDGSAWDPQSLSGKVVLVDFWATWCGPCLAEMDNIRQNYAQYRELGFEVVGVSVDRQLADLQRFLAENPTPWTVLADCHPGIPESDRLSRYYGVSAIPATMLIGRDGKVLSLDCRGPQLGALLARHLQGP
jgi:peroxiredoxin